MDTAGKAIQLAIVGCIFIENGSQLVLQVLVQVYPGVSVIKDGISIGHDSIIGLRVTLALSLHDVPISDVALRPDGGGVAGELVIQGDTEEARRDELCPAGECGCVVSLISQTSAISLVIYPEIESTSRNNTSSPIIGVLIHTLKSNQWIFLSGDTWGHIHVYSLLIHVHSIDPFANLGRSDREVDVSRFGGITHVQVSVDL